MKSSVKSEGGLLTVSDFFRIVTDDQKADLIDGIIYRARSDTLESDGVTGFIRFLVTGFNCMKKLGGRVSGSRYTYRLTKYRAAEPDLAYVCPARLHLIKRQFARGGPDVAVEIVAHGSRARDYILKKRVYKEAKVAEYWIIDPLKNRAEFHRLRGGQYVLVPLEANHIFRSKVIPGFWLDVNWLLAQPLPDMYECLLQIVGQAE